MKRAMTRTRHRPEEIVAKLREADGVLSQGKSLEYVAKSLGGSLVMFLLLELDSGLLTHRFQ